MKTKPWSKEETKSVPGDEMETPNWLYNLLEVVFSFDVDLCSTDSNFKCAYNITDLLTRRPHDFDESIKSAFMNPPYSNPGPFLEKAWDLSKYMTVICLVKDDPSTKWYQDRVRDANEIETAYPYSFDDIRTLNYFRDSNVNLTIVRLPKRIKFEYKGRPLAHTAAFPVCLMIMRRLHYV